MPLRHADVGSTSWNGNLYDGVRHTVQSRSFKSGSLQWSRPSATVQPLRNGCETQPLGSKRFGLVNIPTCNVYSWTCVSVTLLISKFPRSFSLRPEGTVRYRNHLPLEIFQSLNLTHKAEGDQERERETPTQLHTNIDNAMSSLWGYLWGNQTADKIDVEAKKETKALSLEDFEVLQPSKVTSRVPDEDFLILEESEGSNEADNIAFVPTLEGSEILLSASTMLLMEDAFSQPKTSTTDEKNIKEQIPAPLSDGVQHMEAPSDIIQRRDVSRNERRREEREEKKRAGRQQREEQRVAIQERLREAAILDQLAQEALEKKHLSRRELEFEKRRREKMTKQPLVQMSNKTMMHRNCGRSYAAQSRKNKDLRGTIRV
ncbi:hypothetical protein PROFUN_12584 [Planoprotostelium fungivorum]|uniref:Uncharacterized protein n=1 Tax=Planoprotostelium fungivorum TaxID=1890364 RepID=A0A2P6N6U8_9EUKA|nr:hypothetical protein PROFUN_12584 [Planoprotostelium fungivorum]